MNETRKLYNAFGLVIESAFPIPSLKELDAGEPDVRIVPAMLRGVVDTKAPRTSENCNIILTLSETLFRVTGGDLIEADVAEGDTEGFIAMYLMGSCMGAIMTQRGYMLLHGSCVTDGRRSILITGDSGAGKSTLAAEFLKNGWKLITDDVTAVFDVDGTPMVQSSYPSQKLWQDAMDRYEKTDEDVHSLFFTEAREKFGVNVTDHFFEGTCPLSMVLRLVPMDTSCRVGPIEGMAKVDQLLRNTYRLYLIEKRHQQRHFQRCVTLSTKIPMALAIRENGKQCAETLYELITNYLGGMNHD